MNNVIILIPHFNNFSGLCTSVFSIEKDEKVDVLIVDDGSFESTINEMQLLKNKNFKGSIYFIYNEINKGIEHVLNQGLKFILKKEVYKYIARLDCGDLCLDNRFYLQEKYLNDHIQCKLVGSNAIAIDTNGKELYKTILPENSNIIKNKMYLNAMFLHPTVMFCSSIIKEIGYYPTEYKAAEDYAFFFKIAQKYETHNIQKFLLKYEINTNGISLSKRNLQVSSRIKVIKDNFYFGFWPIYGLLRNYALRYLIPQKIINWIKTNK
jgi:hypothetical protein